MSLRKKHSEKEILKELDSQLSEEELEGIIEEVDTDGSGTLDFDGKEKYQRRFLSFCKIMNIFKFPLSFLVTKTVNTNIIFRKNIFDEVYFRVRRNDDRLETERERKATGWESSVPFISVKHLFIII